MSATLLDQFRSGQARLRDDPGGIFVDVGGSTYPIQESQHEGPGTVGWVVVTFEGCMVEVLPGVEDWRPGEWLVHGDRCGLPAFGNGLCRYHGGEGQPGQEHRVGVWCSSLAFLRFMDWCGQQRRENRQAVEYLCSTPPALWRYGLPLVRTPRGGVVYVRPPETSP